MEITSRQVTTGTIRLTYAIILAFMLAYGLQIGSRLYLTLDADVADDGFCGPPVSPWFYIPLVPVMSISIGLSYGSSRHQYASQICCATIGFCVLYFLGKVVSDAQILSTIAAFAMGLYSNFACKLTEEPPLGPLCVGITLLVPGSIGNVRARLLCIIKSYMTYKKGIFLCRCTQCFCILASRRSNTSTLHSSNAASCTRFISRTVRFRHNCIPYGKASIIVYFPLIIRNAHKKTVLSCVHNKVYYIQKPKLVAKYLKHLYSILCVLWDKHRSVTSLPSFTVFDSLLDAFWCLYINQR